VASSTGAKHSPVILRGSNPIGHTQVSPPQPSSSNSKNGLYAAAAAAASNPILLAQMQNWKLDQLEAHVNLLRDANQPVPQPISLLLAEARRREDKRTAKRVANRKSACTSRARKKALVEEMTRTNAKLRRQAMILALLPDLVIAIKIDGEITFCSAQVERVLRHKIDDMVGANILEILLPSSRDSLFKLVERLLAAAAEQAALDDNHKNDQVIAEEGGGSANSGNSRGNGCGGAAIVSESSELGFPTVVKVKSITNSPGTGEDVSVSTPNRSPSPPDELNSTSKAANKDNSSSGGDESSTSTVAKQLTKANEALDSNVRRHNAMLNTKGDIRVNKLAHKDDVTGAFVTANNAGARLSSLQVNTALDLHNDTSSSTSSDSLLAGVEDKRIKARADRRTPGAGGDTSDDSGYRESGESDPLREDSETSTSETSNGSTARPRPLAPTCNITLIRDDLTTILCEVTSSIRTRSSPDENYDGNLSSGGQVSVEKAGVNVSKDKVSNMIINENTGQGSSSTEDSKELLLCLRPIRDGDETTGQDLRFTMNKSVGRIFTIDDEKEINNENGATVMNDAKKNSKMLIDGKEHCMDDGGTADLKAAVDKMKQRKCRPMKKRPHTGTRTNGVVSGSSSSEEPANKKLQRTNSPAGGRAIDAEKSVVESLMLMSSHRK